VHFIGEFADDHDERIDARSASYEPDNINWMNLGRSSRRKDLLRGLLCEIVCVVLTSLTVQLSIEAFQGDYMRKNFNPGSNIFSNQVMQCPATVTMAEAYADIASEEQFQRQQTITCFCRQQYNTLSLSDFLNIDFNAYGKSIQKPPSQTLPNYCT